MENKIDIKFVEDHYVYEGDSLKEILDTSIGIGDKLTFTGGFKGFSCITKVTDDEINITKLNPPHYKSLSPAYERIKIDDIRLVNLHVKGKGYTIWKTLKDCGKEDKEISFNSAEAADIYRKLKTIKNSFKSVTYNKWFDKLEKFVEREELCNDLINK